MQQKGGEDSEVGSEEEQRGQQRRMKRSSKKFKMKVGRGMEKVHVQ